MQAIAGMSCALQRRGTRRFRLKSGVSNRDPRLGLGCRASALVTICPARRGRHAFCHTTLKSDLHYNTDLLVAASKGGPMRCRTKDQNPPPVDQCFRTAPLHLPRNILGPSAMPFGESPNSHGRLAEWADRSVSMSSCAADEAKIRSMFENCVEGNLSDHAFGPVFERQPGAGPHLRLRFAAADLMSELNDIGADSRAGDPPPRVQGAYRPAGFVTDFESEICRKDGSVIWISETSRAVYDAQGQLCCYEGTVTDISRCKQRRDGRGGLPGMFENCVEGIFQTTPSGEYLNVNPALARIYGYDSPQQLMTEFDDIGGATYARKTAAQRVQRTDRAARAWSPNFRSAVAAR